MVLFFRYWKLVFLNSNGAIIIQHNSQNFHEIIFFPTPEQDGEPWLGKFKVLLGCLLQTPRPAQALVTGMITWRGLGPPQREQAPCEGRLPRQFSEYMANTHMAKANKYQVHRKGGKVADNVFFAELAFMGGWRHFARFRNHYCAFANLVPLWDYLIIIKRIIFLIQVGEMHWHAISVPKVASYASANFELCTVHFLHLLHSAHIAQRTYCAIAQCQSISCTAHILHWLVAQLSSI